MDAGLITTLVKKDLTMLVRNPTLTVVPTIFLVLLIGLYFFLPDKVDETMQLATIGSPLPQAFVAELEEADGMALVELESEKELREGVEDGDYFMGIVFPPDMNARIAAGERPEVQAIFSPAMVPEMKEAGARLVEQLVFMMQGQPVEVEHDVDEIMGPNMSGRQIPMRDRLLPIIALFIILVEIISLAILIVDEFEAGTIRALRVTALPMSSLWTAKAITGLGLAFLQAVFLLAITGTLFTHPLLLLCGLLLGSLLVAGLGFLIAALSRDMMTVFAWGALAMMVLFLPALNTIFPGMMSGWVEVIPTHYLADLMHRVAHFDAGWADMGRNLAILLAFDLALLLLGAAALKRRSA